MACPLVASGESRRAGTVGAIRVRIVDADLRTTGQRTRVRRELKEPVLAQRLRCFGPHALHLDSCLERVLTAPLRESRKTRSRKSRTLHRLTAFPEVGVGVKPTSLSA